MQPRLDDVFADVENAGSLFSGQVLDIAQQDHGAIDLRQFANGALEDASNLGAARRIFGAADQSAISIEPSPSPFFLGCNSSSDNSAFGAKTLRRRFIRHSLRAMRKTQDFRCSGSRS